MLTITVQEETDQRLIHQEAVLKTTIDSVVEQLAQDEHVNGNGPFMLTDEEWRKNIDAIFVTARCRANRYPPAFEAGIIRE